MRKVDAKLIGLAIGSHERPLTHITEHNTRLQRGHSLFFGTHGVYSLHNLD